MNVSILICTYGDPAWGELAWSRAYPSTIDQGAREVIVHHSDNATLAQVRNTAAAGASGDGLVFLDADDELAPGYIEAMGAAICPHGDPLCPCPDGLVCNYAADESTPAWDPPRPSALLVPAVQYVSIDHAEPPRVLNDGRALSEINRAVIGTLMPRGLFLEVGGFDDSLPLYEDWAIFLACERAGATLVDVPDAVYRAWVSPRGRNLPPLNERTSAYTLIQRDHEQKLAESRRQEALL